jgi:hypothetical protein
MSDFKFACPNCSQKISATDEYIGQQITCPACRATIVVPGTAPAAARSSIATPTPPGAPPPPAPPVKGKLGVAALSSPQEHSAPSHSNLTGVGAAAFEAHLAKKEKKSYVGLISGIAAVLIVGILGITNKAWVVKKFNDVSGRTAEFEATNVPPPPPPPPELTVDEIWQKVAETYKDVPSLTATGKHTSVLDYSKINSAAVTPITVSGDLTLKATRPGDFRIDLNIARGGSNLLTTGWSAGGSYIQANQTRSVAPSPEIVLDYFAKGLGVGPGGFGVGAGDVIRLFMDDPHGTLPKLAEDWSRTNDDKINGETNYVLVGTARFQNVRVWVSRKTFLISQTQVDLDGESSVAALDDNQLKSTLMTMYGLKQVTTAQLKVARQLAKLKGTVTDTYQNIQTNMTIAMADLEPAKPVVAAPVAATPVPVTAADEGGGTFNGMGGGGGGGGRGGGGGGGGGGRRR